MDKKINNGERQNGKRKESRKLQGRLTAIRFKFKEEKWNKSEIRSKKEGKSHVDKVKNKTKGMRKGVYTKKGRGLREQGIYGQETTERNC